MDIFSIDYILELIDKSKDQIKRELDMKVLENNKLSLESDHLLQVLDYTPKTFLSEKEIICSYPIIKIKPQKIEKKSPIKNKHVKLVSTPNIDIDSLALNKNNIQNSKLEIINKDNTDKKEKEEKKEENDEDEEDEEFERRYEQRQRQIEEREKKKKNLNREEFELFHHKTTKVLNVKEFMEGIAPLDKKMEIEVKLFKNKNKIILSITDKETVKDIKKLIIQNLILKKIDLKYSSYKDYNLILNESSSKNDKKDLILENDQILFDLKPKIISFIEKDNDNDGLNKDKAKDKIIDDIKNAEIKIEATDIKINYKIGGINYYKIINISLNDNLKKILDIFFKKNILKEKNIESYFFVDFKKSPESENALNLDILIRNLPSNELNLYHKNNSNINNNEEMKFKSDDEKK